MPASLPQPADREVVSVVVVPAISTAPATSAPKILKPAMNRSKALLATIMPLPFFWRAGANRPAAGSHFADAKSARQCRRALRLASCVRVKAGRKICGNRSTRREPCEVNAASGHQRGNETLQMRSIGRSRRNRIQKFENSVQAIWQNGLVHAIASRSMSGHVSDPCRKCTPVQRRPKRAFD
ncbi:MAG: hypothetical protein K2Y27_21330 [Xanthobacteraceae bacterium]|nr:hypothetical protein [Xanthobacteraceae bacterium]